MVLNLFKKRSRQTAVKDKEQAYAGAYPGRVRVVLIDVNPKMVKAWQESFESNPEVEILHGSILEQQVSAWVTPTNSAAAMDGGLDAVIKSFLGAKIEQRVKKAISRNHGGSLPVGHATCVATDEPNPRYLISTPTMVSSSEDISDTMNVVLAAGAALQAVHMQNEKLPGSIRSLALPGLGAATGRTPVEICADLMWTAYDLFRDAAFHDFAGMRAALEEHLGDLGPVTAKGQAKIKVQVPAAAAKAPVELPPLEEDVDFDDFDEEGDFDDDDFDDEEP